MDECNWIPQNETEGIPVQVRPPAGVDECLRVLRPPPLGGKATPGPAAATAGAPAYFLTLWPAHQKLTQPAGAAPAASR